MKQLLFITCLLTGMMYSGYAQVRPPGPPKKSMSHSIIEFVQTDNCLSIFFYADMGKADINVILISGVTVYHSNISIVSGSGVAINTSGTDYIVRITGSEGNIIKETMYNKD